MLFGHHVKKSGHINKIGFEKQDFLVSCQPIYGFGDPVSGFYFSGGQTGSLLFRHLEFYPAAGKYRQFLQLGNRFSCNYFAGSK